MPSELNMIAHPTLNAYYQRIVAWENEQKAQNQTSLPKQIHAQAVNYVTTRLEAMCMTQYDTIPHNEIIRAWDQAWVDAIQAIHYRRIWDAEEWQDMRPDIHEAKKLFNRECQRLLQDSVNELEPHIPITRIDYGEPIVRAETDISPKALRAYAREWETRKPAMLENAMLTDQPQSWQRTARLVLDIAIGSIIKNLTGSIGAGKYLSLEAYQGTIGTAWADAQREVLAGIRLGPGYAADEMTRKAEKLRDMLADESCAIAETVYTQSLLGPRPELIRGGFLAGEIQSDSGKHSNRLR
jgi:hypothetical protein